MERSAETDSSKWDVNNLNAMLSNWIALVLLYLLPLFGIGTVVIVYLFTAFDSSMYVWYDYVLGILYFFASFFFCYRSPMYWSLGRIKGYPLSDRSAYGLEMRKITKA